MKAMILRHVAPIDSSPLELAELPIPEPHDREVRLRVRCCAICRTDLHVIEGDLPQEKLPIVPGHQIVGHGGQVGARLSAVVPWASGSAWPGCGTPAASAASAPRARRISANRPGSRATMPTAAMPSTPSCPRNSPTRSPSVLTDLEAAPLLCAGIIGYRALTRANVPRGGRLALYGFGSSAHVVIQIALHRGCEVYVVTRGEQPSGARAADGGRLGRARTRPRCR